MSKILRAALLTLGCTSLSFADTLQDVYELAVKNDPQLKAAEANYMANSENIGVARSTLLPQISGQYYVQESERESRGIGITGFGPGGATFGVTNSDTVTDGEGYSLTLNQAIFDLGAWFGYEAVKKSERQAQAQFAAAQQALMVRVAEAYLNVLRAEDNLAANRAEERAAKRQMEQTQQRFDVGLIAITDVHEARANHDSTVARRLNAEGQLGAAKELLSVLTNVEHGQLWILDEEFPIAEPTPSDRSEWVSFALENNLDLKAARLGAEAAKQTATAKKTLHLPNISGSYTVNNSKDDKADNTNSALSSPSSFTDAENKTWRINVNVPIFSGGRVSAERKQAYAQYDAAYQQSVLLQRQTVQATRAQHINVLTAVQTVKARKQATVSTQSALEATEAGYEVGTRNIVDVLQAQRASYAAQRDYANARYDYILSSLKLKQLAGTLSANDLMDINKWLESPGPALASEHTGSEEAISEDEPETSSEENTGEGNTNSPEEAEATVPLTEASDIAENAEASADEAVE